MKMRLFAVIALTALSVSHGQVRNSGKNPAADWPMYNRDLGGTRFSPLTQITTRNVARLVPAWSYKIGKVKAEGITGGAEMTPIVVNGTMFLATNNKLVALEPETGRELGAYELKEGEP